VGPTGVGKTLLAKALAQFMFGEEEALVQIDMSEYMEKHNVSRLVGAPPGYVGFEEGGQLTEKIRRRPYAVVLFDEIEKAHHDIFNMLLQIMEEGRLTDSYGRNVDFRNTLIIMTSNVGAQILKNQSTLGFQSTSSDKTYEKMKDMLVKEVEHHFRPEFLNRVDEIIVFKQLDRNDLKKVIEIELAGVKERLQQRNIFMEVTEEAKELLITEGYNPDFGARPLRRTIERRIEDPLSEEILKGAFGEACELLVEVRDGHIFFLPKVKAEEPEPEEAQAVDGG
jgi:ATP-dependent Clp protease ATP-binding subunit ClpC